MKYFLGQLIVNGTTDASRENDAGIICIGGDVLDVYAAAAYGEAGGKVKLVDVTVVTGDNFKGLKGQKLRDELENATTDAIAESYASIQAETFRRSRKAEIPAGDEIIVPA